MEMGLLVQLKHSLAVEAWVFQTERMRVGMRGHAIP